MFRRLIALQLISNGLLLAIGNLVGLYYQYMTMAGRQRTVERTRSCVESRVRLECEKEHQEQLLLSVIPAYIAAEVSQSTLNREREGGGCASGMYFLEEAGKIYKIQ